MSGLVGAQTPTFHVGEAAPDLSTADDAIELAAAGGVELLPWQADRVRDALGLRTNGDYQATRVGLAVPRQSGKGVILEVVTLAKTVLLGERVLWTAHEVRTMQESFARFRALLESTPALAAMVSSIRAANGQERILFTNGAEVKFSARSKSATRGLGFRSIICDEAQELDYLTLGAMLPTLSGQGDARTQLILTGTPPYSAKGEVFADTRVSAYGDADARLSWSEWSCELEDRLDDPDVWARTNPSLGAVIRVEKIADELAALQARPAVFRRERLGEWGRSGDDALALDEAEWLRGSVSAFPQRLETIRVIGVDCTYNAEMTTLVEASLFADGQVGLSVLDAAPGLEWVAGALAAVKETSSRVVVTFDPIRTGDLTADLRDVGIRDRGDRRRVVPVSARDLTLACDGLVRAVREGKVLHADPRLDAAAAGATRSTFDDGRGWKIVGINGVDVSPVIAGALALRALRDQRVKKPSSDRRAMIL